MIKKLIGALLFSQAAIGQEITNFDRVQIHENFIVLSVDGARPSHMNQQEYNSVNFIRTRKSISDYLLAQEKEITLENKSPPSTRTQTRIRNEM